MLERGLSQLGSMRLRIAVSVAVFALLTILAQSFALLLAFDEQEEEFIDEMLSQQIAHSMQLWADNPALAYPNTPDMQLYRLPLSAAPDPSPAVLPPALAHLARLTIGNHEIYLQGREYHVAVRADDTARYLLLYDVDEHESRLKALTGIVISGAFLLAAVLLTGSYWLAGRLTRRLERLAVRVASGESAPLVEPGMAKELRALAEALEQAQQRQAANLARERTFAANLSHELRTPLTAIRTDAELIASCTHLDADKLPRIVRRSLRIIASVDRINATAASLLALAREPRGQAQAMEALDVTALAARLWQTLTQASNHPAATLQIDLPAGTRLTGDPALIELIVRNLLENALRHSTLGQVRLFLDQQTLGISDDGPGFGDALLAAPEGRGRLDGADGSNGAGGLGLALVRQACDVSGWVLHLGNGANGGGEVRIDFAASLQPGPG